MQPLFAQESRPVGHTHDILEVKFNADATKLISYSWGDGWLILWDVKSGRALWQSKTGFIQKGEEYYTLTCFAFNPDETRIVSGSGNGTVQLWDALTGRPLWRSEAHIDNVTAVGFNPDGKTIVSAATPEAGDNETKILNVEDGSVIKQLQEKLTTGERHQPSQSIDTGKAVDLSQDKTLLAEGGRWGNAVIKITDRQTGKSRVLNGKGQRLPPYQPTELENRLNKEKAERQALLKAELAHRNQQAAIDAEKFKSQVYISFEHYGEMTDPGSLRMAESDAPNKSKIKKAVSEANAVWLRLHNDSPLPIKIPTQSMYLPQNPKCFYGYANDKKLLGLCDNREISIWHGLEDKKGKALPYGFDFGSSSILLPHTSALFPVPMELLKNGQAIHFRYAFLKETNENKIAEYGEELGLKFRQTDLRPEK